MPLFWSRIRRLLRYLFAILLLCIPLALAWAAYLAIDDTPLLAPAPSLAFTPSRMASAQRLLARIDPRKTPPGALRTLQLGEDDLNLAVAYIASHRPHTRAQMVLQDGSATLRASTFLPPNPFGDYLNIQAVLTETPGTPKVEQLTLGRLTVPPKIANQLLRFGLWRLQASPAAAAADSIQHVGVRNGVLSVQFVWNDAIPAQLQAALVPPEVQARLQAYQGRLVEVAAQPGPRGLSLGALAQPLFELSAQRSDDKNSLADEHRAALVALAFYVNGKGIGAILPAARDWPRPAPRTTTLAGRTDTAQHFSISAALAATAGSPLADMVGVYKELDDAQGGSGFSFNDLAADRAGTRLGELATGGAAAQLSLQKRLAQGLSDADLLPKVSDLPEDLQMAEFQKRFGGVDGPGYKKMATEIERRIGALGLYR
ncbi:hypothetical protein [Rhodoferax sp.]|uniref:hypothetical protein n=1 Tax=Rhodoferax sp. TaxID=50421 RepID=UPI0025FD04C4|nr:hypothetical protein [Rhodoferax sp.]